MPVRIRLRRMGAKKQPSYRLVVADARAPRDGRFIDALGFYNPLREPAEVVIDEEKALMWLRRGAQPTETARNLLARQGVLAKFEAEGGRVITVPEPEREVREETYTEAPLERLAEEAGGEEEAMAAPEGVAPTVQVEQAPPAEEAEATAAPEGVAATVQVEQAPPAEEEEATAAPEEVAPTVQVEQALPAEEKQG